jgi:crotonobetainyl-CoA:carnitine CoA-transferase CaiB-like acyl-CoA transferase
MEGPLMALPLDRLRVVDMADGKGEMCGRFLADLGADVVRVEPSGGARSRHAQPMHDGVSLPFLARNANKRSVLLDLHDAGGRAQLLDLLAGADIWIESGAPGAWSAVGLDPVEVQSRLPHLVVLSITDFGHTGPYRHWVATDWVLLAMACVLSRSGVPGRPPFMPPGDMADETTSIQAAWAVLLAYWNRLETGVGDVLDFSRYEATAQILDPAFGTIGTAAAAQAGTAALPRGRPGSVLYPIFPCADGHVRVVILAPRQWRAMRSWMGEPEEFSDPKYDHAGRRFKAADRLYPLIEALFSQQTAMELVSEGQRRGIPIAPVLAPGAAIGADHFAVRGTFTAAPVSPAATGRLPTGHVLIDGERAGVRRPAPAPGQDDPVAWDRRMSSGQRALPRAGRRPLDGLRVLDLGVIVMGGEAGRLFADQGADVIKVENRRFADGARMMGMTSNFAVGHRNKRSLGLNLREPEGIALFERLVALSDVVLTNFKPGTLESLGLGYDRLRSINQGVVLVTSSAMGESGPWRDWMGYGPLVRCVSGLTSLWRDTDASTDGFGDGTTVYPDHFVARVVAAAVLAVLIRRRESGQGGHIESSQAESIIVALGPQYLRESLEPGSARPLIEGELDAPWGIYRCAGDDEWCVVTVRSDDDWGRLVDALGQPSWALDPALATRHGRLAWRETIDGALGEWTMNRAPREVAKILQEAGVPAGMMERITDQLEDPHLVERGFFFRFAQPGMDTDVITEGGPCRARRLPEPELRPAPFHGQHTREVCRQLLDMTDAEVDALVERGVLEEATEQDAGLLLPPG